MRWLVLVSAQADSTVVIEGRFNGPPASGNGGYTCGVVANLLGEGPAEVVLRAPPPLDQPLEVLKAPGNVTLYDGETLVAEGRKLDRLELELREVLDAESGESARANYPWFEGHPFPTCFVCGPRRPAHDGLEIFAGRFEDSDLYASTWTPAAEHADADGWIRPEIVWAALDCPTGLVALTSEEPTFGVLGTLAVSIDAPVAAGEQHTVTSWSFGIDGRKRPAAAVISGPDGEVKARSRALWIELRN